MYSTCTFCHAPLGANESLEHFPVGRRLAFDGKRGRLWVVCAVCRQWNLSPLETRWEGIEEAERAYRGTKLRVATDQIGLARLADGTELIRIGEPLRPEFAAWRYGERFAARWKYQGRGAAVGGGALAVLAAVVKLPYVWTVATVPVAMGAAVVLASSGVRRGSRVARVKLPGGKLGWLSQAHLHAMRFVRDRETERGWRLVLSYKPDEWPVKFFESNDPIVVLRGDAAHRVAQQLLPRVNRGGGPRASVADAVRLLETHGGADSVLRLLATHAAPSRDTPFSRAFGDEQAKKIEEQTPPILRVPTEIRLAAEMAVHEETERRALEGELAVLESAWREAEEVAGIADNLTLSPAVLRAMETLRLR